jgi:hypothetical protein
MLIERQAGGTVDTAVDARRTAQTLGLSNIITGSFIIYISPDRRVQVLSLPFVRSTWCLFLLAVWHSTWL